MDLSDLHRSKRKPHRVGAARRARLKPLSKMTPAEIETLPESEFARLLSGKVRRELEEENGVGVTIPRPPAQHRKASSPRSA